MKYLISYAALSIILVLSILTGGFTGFPGITGQAVTLNPDAVKFELFVMSQCPYGVQAEDLMPEVINAFGADLDFRLQFIANDNGDGTFRSLHGQPEVDEDLRQVCAIKHYPANYMDYIICLNKNYRNAGTIWKSCAEEAGLDINTISTCYQGTEGAELLSNNIEKAIELGVGGSPTIYIDDSRYNGPRNAAGFQQVICSVNPDLSGCSVQLSGTAGAAVQGGC